MPWFVRLAVIAVVLVVYFSGLDRVGLLGPDEPRYASIGREMAESGDWVTPRLWGEAWFEKPVLLYWLVAAASRVGLSTDLAPRLPVALLGAGFLAVFWWLLREQWGARAAWFSTAILGTSAGWMAYSRLAVTDIPLSVCFGLFGLLSMRAMQDGGAGRLPWAGAALGAAVLAKGLVPLVLAAPVLWFTRSRWRLWWRWMIPAALTALPWYLLVTARNGSAFLDEFFWKHHFGRFATPDLQHVQPFWFYIPVLAAGLFPWTPLLVLLRAPAGDAARRFLWGWLLFGLLFFSASRNKLPGYLLPLLPAVCALLGDALDRARRATAPLAFAAALLGLLPLIAAILPEAVATGIRRAWPEQGWLWAVASMLAAALAGWIVTHRWGNSGAVLALSVAVGLGVWYLQRTVFPVLDRVVSARGAWRQLEPRAADVCLDGPHRAVRYGLNYYSRTPLPDCETSPRPVKWPSATDSRPR